MIVRWLYEWRVPCYHFPDLCCFPKCPGFLEPLSPCLHSRRDFSCRLLQPTTSRITVLRRDFYLIRIPLQAKLSALINHLYPGNPASHYNNINNINNLPLYHNTDHLQSRPETNTRGCRRRGLGFKDQPWLWPVLLNTLETQSNGTTWALTMGPVPKANKERRRFNVIKSQNS